MEPLKHSVDLCLSGLFRNLHHLAAAVLFHGVSIKFDQFRRRQNFLLLLRWASKLYRAMVISFSSYVAPFFQIKLFIFGIEKLA